MMRHFEILSISLKATVSDWLLSVKLFLQDARLPRLEVTKKTVDSR